MIRRTLTALTFACAAALPAGAFDLTAMTEEERAAFRDEVRAYLLDNPEIIMEAVGVLEERQQAAMAEADRDLVDAHAAAIFEDGHSWIGGNPDGDVTLVEFIDYRCGFCRRAHPEVAELIESDGNIRRIVKEFPILGEQSVLSSRFAIATQRVAGDDAYKTAHDALMTFRAEVTPAALDRLAGELDLDADAIMAEMMSPEVDAVIAANRALAEELQITGTPTFVLKDRMLRGYLPLDEMRAVVAEAREG